MRQKLGGSLKGAYNPPMGHRLSKIYTRTGDDGSTGLGDGQRVPKTSYRIAAIGDVDELNCLLGLLLAEDPPGDISTILTDVQHVLFDLGGELSIPSARHLGPEYTVRIETAIDSFNADLPPLKEFILPAGGRAASLCHLARAVCRRAERSILKLAEPGDVNEHALTFLNRLSDLLFVLARVLSRRDGCTEVLWQKNRFDRS